MKLTRIKLKEIIREELLNRKPKLESVSAWMNEGSLDWEKNFKGFSAKELSAIESLVMMSAGGISDVLKDYKKNKRAFKAFIKDMVKSGMFEGKLTEGKKVPFDKVKVR